MKIKALKPELGHWLSIEELRGFLAETPREVCQGIPVNRKLLEIASEFVEERRGWWEHPDWESFLDKLNQEGFSLTEDVKAPIGNILEIFKAYYHNGNFETILEKCQKTQQPQDDAVPTARSSKGFETEKQA